MNIKKITRQIMPEGGVTIRIASDLLALLNATAEHLNVSASFIIRTSLRAFKNGFVIDKTKIKIYDKKRDAKCCLYLKELTFKDIDRKEFYACLEQRCREALEIPKYTYPDIPITEPFNIVETDKDE